MYSDPDLVAQRAAECVKQGFTAVKFDPVGPYSAFDPRQLSLEALERVEKFVKNIREAVGSKCDLLFGTHGQMTTSSAIRLAKRLERFDPLWLEEPVPPENVEEMARVARSTSIPIASGERLATKYEFARLLGKQAASILQMALGRVGGILEAKKIAGMAEAHYAQSGYVVQQTNLDRLEPLNHRRNGACGMRRQEGRSDAHRQRDGR